MSLFQRDVTIEWGDCDDAGIVFYPNYFYWFDSTFHAMMRSLGMGQRLVQAEFNAVTPLFDVGASFRSPVTYDDVITISADLGEMTERRFRIDYTVTCGDRPVATGFEKRAWAVYTPDGGIKGAPIPDAFRNCFKKP
jgi:YbgC/YbaW family acyl-CoA thioester hydrolase